MALETLPSRYLDCFISYGTPDVEFANRLVEDLKDTGVKCWFYPRDSTPGARTQAEITTRRREAGKMILLCSYQSLLQHGVLTEVDDQIREQPDKLVPISLDDVWQHQGFRVAHGDRDLKPFLLDRNYADFSNVGTYDSSFARLLAALENPAFEAHEETQPTEPREVAAQLLQQRVRGIDRLLHLRGDAEDLRFAAQILDELAAVIGLRYELFPPDTVENPRVYVDLLKTLNNESAPAVEQLRMVLEDQPMNLVGLRREFERVSATLNRRDSSVAGVEVVQSGLSRLYTAVSAIVAGETEKQNVEAKVAFLSGASSREGDHIEYKSTYRYNLETKRTDKRMMFDVVRAIAALGNHQGGTLYIGVDDRSRVLGMEDDLRLFKQEDPHQAKDKLRVHFDTLINQRLGVEHYQVVQPDWAKPEGKDVFVVRVRPSSMPLFLDGEFFVRRGAQTVKLSAHKFYEYYKARWLEQPRPEARNED